MRRLLMLAALLVGIGTAAPLLATQSASAVNVFEPCYGTAAKNSPACVDAKNQNGSGKNPIINDIRIIIQVLAVLIGIAATIIIIISGLRIASAGGDAQAIASARSGIVFALVGIVIAVMAELIVAFVLKSL